MINYYLLMKPGILLGNLFTVAAGFLLASKGIIDFKLFLMTLLGLAFIMASGCVFNNYLDQPIDKKMQRTKDRALVKGLISGPQAIVFATVLLVLGNLVLYSFTNLLTLAIADFGFVVYVFLYTLWKCHTVYGTAIGSIAGAVPPVVGYCAVSNRLDAGAIILFSMMVLWQMPHFFSIALFRIEDYLAAGIPVLPIKKGLLQTKIHMIIYIIAFTIASILLTIFSYTGFIYLAVVSLMGLAWLFLGLKGFDADNDQVWGKQMFKLSLVIIAAICVVIPFDTLNK